MNQFKVGDIVRRIERNNFDALGTWVLKVGTICKVIDVIGYSSIRVEAKGVPADVGHNAYFFELVKESEMFDMKKNPWYIEVSKETFPSIQKWLLEEYGTKLACDYFPSLRVLTNARDDGIVVNNFVMWSSELPENALEIKFTFKTTIDKVSLPEVESEAQKKLRELEEQQRQLADEIEKLRKSLHEDTK